MLKRKPVLSALMPVDNFVSVCFGMRGGGGGGEGDDAEREGLVEGGDDWVDGCVSGYF